MRSHFLILTHCPHATACYLISLLIDIHGLSRTWLLLLGMPWLLLEMPLTGHSLLGSPWLAWGVSLCLWGFSKGQHSCVVSLEGQLCMPTSYAVDMHAEGEHLLSRHTVQDTIQTHTDRNVEEQG